mgnify:CR=1 FL=1
MKNYTHFSGSGEDASGEPSEEERRRKILFRQCMHIVETYVSSHVRNPDDVSNLQQEALLKICEALSLSHYDERGHFESWALTVTMNVVRDYYRRKQRSPVIVSSDKDLIILIEKEELQSSNPLLLESYYEKEEKAVLELSLDDQGLINDIIDGKLSFRQAGEKRGISKSACFKHYQKILAELRRKFINEGMDLKSFDDNL